MITDDHGASCTVRLYRVPQVEIKLRKAQERPKKSPRKAQKSCVELPAGPVQDPGATSCTSWPSQIQREASRSIAKHREATKGQGCISKICENLPTNEDQSRPNVMERDQNQGFQRIQYPTNISEIHPNQPKSMRLLALR